MNCEQTYDGFFTGPLLNKLKIKGQLCDLLLQVYIFRSLTGDAKNADWKEVRTDWSLYNQANPGSHFWLR